MLSFFTNKKKQRKEKVKNFQKNGSLLLEQLIETSGGIYNPIPTFSSDQILKAINYFDWNYLIFDFRFMWYKGMIENRSVLIKKCQDCFPFNADNFYRDIAVSSLMSSHKNVLKLLGCCLEFPHPFIVYEYPQNGSLNCIRHPKDGFRYAKEIVDCTSESLTWDVRLRIAKEIADSIAYLHTKFPRTIVHRDLKLENIFLDENLSVKLSTFSLSILIPEGESGVINMVCGTTSYLEHGYMTTGIVTEHVDIYSLGFIMLLLFTGNCIDSHVIRLLPEYVGKFLERGLLTELIDPSMLDSASDDIPQRTRLQMEAFIELGFRCVRFRPGENVPHMIDVAKELRKIENFT